jgi:HlyD family secretion protein
MKRVLSIVLIVLFAAAVVGTFWFLWSKGRKKPTAFQTEKPAVQDIVRKTVATGAIVPRQEVEIKPRVSGVLEELFVEAGAVVKTGDKIAKIQIVPDAVSLNRAEAEVKAARIAFDNARRELARSESLFKQGVISEADVDLWKTQHALRKQELDAATANQQLVKEGATRGSKASNIIVTSTVDGMVIDVPVKIGFSVTETNNFNAGTTIAAIADMGDMIFQGQVDESEVGKIKSGMKLQIKIGALEKETFEGTLEYIAPKGKEIDGAIQFEIKAAIVPKEGVFIRAGYSANADIVLEEKKQVLAIREAVLQFDEGKTFVEVETAPKTFERRDVEVGLSDGVHVEVKSGVAAEDTLKIPGNAGPASMRGGPGMGARPPRRAR